jgi:carbonic anhydrase
MVASFSTPRTAAFAFCLGLGLAMSSLALAEHAVEHATEPKPDAKTESKTDPKSEHKAAGKLESKQPMSPQKAEESAAAAASAPPDPMDMLRDRLAQKLGGAKVREADNRTVLRVVSNVTTTPGTLGVHEGAPAAKRAPRRSAVVPEAAADPHPAHWDYAGEGGPQRWGEINPEFAKCATGQRQSPIDIRDGIKVELEPVNFDYKPSAFRVIDNGHTVQVNVGPGNSIEVMGRRFELLQFHFHRPSEERIDGRQFDMVMHLVHKDVDGRLAVVAVLLDRGSAQPIVQAVWNNLPLEKGEELAARTMLNPTELLPADRSYFTYMGSLTTPPCSEGVLWMVMKNPVPISAEQIGVFARLYPMNARPIQSASGRLIKQSN